MDAILEAGWKSGRREGIDAYFNVVLKANPKTFLEVHKMRTATFEEVFTEAGIIPEWLERGRVQGKAEGIEASKLDIARKMKGMGDSIEKIQIITDLPLETIEQL
jgi:predicted transposase YdaD